MFEKNREYEDKKNTIKSNIKCTVKKNETYY